MNEKIILCQIAEGNENAFRELYEHYRNKVYYVSWKLLKSDSSAEDVLQEIFLKIWINKEKLPLIENFNAYLNTLIHNHIYNKLRKQANEERFIREFVTTDISSPNFTFDTVLLKESQNLLKKAILHLPSQQKRVFELSRFEGKKHEEIAGILNISKETVKKHIMEASRTVKSFFDSKAQLLILGILLLLCRN